MKAEPRRAVPMKLQRDAALALCATLMKRLGLVPVEADVEWELDHDPALVLRAVDPATGQHVPHQHDPRYLVWLTKEGHDRKTNGRGGEKRTTTHGSDSHAAAQLKRVSDASIEHFRRMALRQDERAAEQKPKLTKRGHRPMQSRVEPKQRPTRTPVQTLRSLEERLS